MIKEDCGQQVFNVIKMPSATAIIWLLYRSVATVISILVKF